MGAITAINSTARRVPTWVIYSVGALPAVWLIWLTLTNGLGADPVKALERSFGEWGLRFLIGSLAISPLMQRGIRLLKFRRAIGLLGFAYITLHFATWITLDMGLRWGELLGELYKRPFIIVGFAGFLALVPLAATSWNGAIRRMGAATWALLHRLAYPAILAGAVHFVMIGKVWSIDSLIYLGLTTALLALRLAKKTTLRRQTS
jgi:sulfoxide reductase heme-binding subunit YedZ